MTRDHGEKLIQALNTIELQRKNQANEYLTETQGKTVVALLDLLKEEGFEVHSRAIDRNVKEFSITSQTAYNWNF